MASQRIKITYSTFKRPQSPLIVGRVVKGGRSATRKG